MLRIVAPAGDAGKEAFALTKLIARLHACDFMCTMLERKLLALTKLIARLHATSCA